MNAQLFIIIILGCTKRYVSRQPRASFPFKTPGLLPTMFHLAATNPSDQPGPYRRPLRTQDRVRVIRLIDAVVGCLLATRGDEVAQR